MISNGRIVLDDELEWEIGHFGYRFPDLLTTTRDSTLLPTYNLDETDFRNVIQGSNARAGSKPGSVRGRTFNNAQLGRAVATSLITNQVAARFKQNIGLAGGRPRAGRMGGLKGIMMSTIVVDAKDEIMDQLDDMGAKSRAELASLDPRALHALLEVNKSLSKKRKERKKRMDALGIFPPEYNEVRARSMLRVEHRRAMNHEKTKRGAKESGSRSPSRARSPEKGRRASAASPNQGRRKSAASPSPGRASPTKGLGGLWGGALAKAAEHAEADHDREKRSSSVRPSSSGRAASPPHPNAKALKDSMQRYSSPPQTAATTKRKESTGHSGSNPRSRPASAAPKPPAPLNPAMVAQQVLQERKVAKEQTLFGRMEALLESVTMMDLPPDAFQATGFLGLKHPRVLDLNIMREGLLARRREKEEDEFWEQHGVYEAKSPSTSAAPKVVMDSATARKVAKQAARRARRMEQEMTKYRNNQRASINRMLDGLGIDAPSDDVRVSLLVADAVKAKMKQDYDRVHPLEPGLVEQEASAIQHLASPDLLLLAKVGMMDALSQLEYLKSSPVFGGPEPDPISGESSRAGGAASTISSIQAEAARLRGTASSLVRILHNENPEPPMSVQALYEEATSRSGVANLDDLAESSSSSLLQERVVQAAHSMRRARTIKFQSSKLDLDEDSEARLDSAEDVGLARAPPSPPKARVQALAAALSAASTPRAPPPAQKTPAVESLVRATTQIGVLKTLRNLREKQMAKEGEKKEAASAAKPPLPELRFADPSNAPSREELAQLTRGMNRIDPLAPPPAPSAAAPQPLATPRASLSNRPPPSPAPQPVKQPRQSFTGVPSSPNIARAHSSTGLLAVSPAPLYSELSAQAPPPPATPKQPEVYPGMLAVPPGTPPTGAGLTSAPTLQSRLEVVWDSLRFPALLRAQMGDKYTSDEHSSRFTDALRVWEVAAAAVVQREAALRHLVHLQGGISRGLQASELLHLREVLSAVRVSHGTAVMARDSLREAFGDTLLYEGKPYPPEEIGGGELRHLFAYALEKSMSLGLVGPGQFNQDPFL